MREMTAQEINYVETGITTEPFDAERDNMQRAINSGVSVEDYKTVRLWEENYRQQHKGASERNVRRAARRQFPSLQIN